MKRGRGTGAGVFAIDDRDAADAHVAQDDLSAHALLASDETLHRVAHNCGLDLFLVHSRARKRGVYLVARDDFHAGAEILSELHHAGADDRYFTHVDISLMAGLAR